MSPASELPPGMIKLELPIRPSIVCLCGSTRFKEEFEEWEKTLTLMGVIVLTVGFFGHRESEPLTDELKRELDELHLRKIDLANSIMVLNVGGYVGQSTKSEIEYAARLGKHIAWLEPHPSEVIVCSVYADDALLIPVVGEVGEVYAYSLGWGKSPDGQWECPGCHERESRYQRASAE